MKLNFLGCGSAYFPTLGNTSAWFYHEDTFFLLDCGETVFRALKEADVLQNIARAVLVITHMHADHCGSLPTLLSYLHGRMGVPVTIVHPDGERMRAFLAACGASADSCELLDGEMAKEINGVTLEPVRVSHVRNMRCYGYVVCCEGETLYYSGDASSVPGEVLKRFLDGGIERMYIDCCVGPNRDHGELDRHCAAIPESQRGRVVCMHLKPSDMETIRRQGFTLAGQEER